MDFSLIIEVVTAGNNVSKKPSNDNPIASGNPLVTRTSSLLLSLVCSSSLQP